MPPEGRTILTDALRAAGVRHTIRVMGGGAEHAFMRDEGPRYDPAAADAVWAEAVGLFRRVPGGNP